MMNFLSTFLSEWALDAVLDSIKTIPFLFFVFLFIELFEHFWADKIRGFLQHSKKEGPILGAGAALIPQCGFSVVASTLYTKGFLTKGTIVAVYLATSDEAIPVLLMYPKFIPYILPLILIKFFVAICAGYLIDCFIKTNIKKNETTEHEDHAEGCCRHDVTVHRKRDFLIHPIRHTLSVFVFILVLELMLSYLIEATDFTSVFNLNNSFLPPLIASFVGLIPNCAVSVGFVLMFIKGTITFGTLLSGLMASSGIGLLILFKNNKNKKDTLFILSALVLVSFLSGILVQLFKV